MALEGRGRWGWCREVACTDWSMRLSSLHILVTESWHSSSFLPSRTTVSWCISCLLSFRLDYVATYSFPSDWMTLQHFHFLVLCWLQWHNKMVVHFIVQLYLWTHHQHVTFQYISLIHLSPQDALHLVSSSSNSSYIVNAQFSKFWESKMR
jgi:hypothetical protein